MARRAIEIDSDDELPELATLLKNKSTKITKDGAEKTTVRAAATVGRGPGTMKAGEQKAKPRRRVLNGVSDNPLLRPLGKEVGREKERKGRGKAASSALVAVSASGGGGVGVVESGGVGGVLAAAEKNQMMLKEAERGVKEGTEMLLRQLNGMEERINGGVDRIQGHVGGREGRGVDKVVEDLEGLHLEEEEDVAKPKARRGRVVKAVAVAVAVEQAQTPEEEDDSLVVDTRTRRVRMGKPAPIVRAETPEEDDSVVEDEEEDMSDFIVSDDSSVEELEEEDDLSPVPAPKSVRKLVRGRRPDTSSQLDVPKAKESQALYLDWSDDDTKEESVAPRPVTRRLFPPEKDQDTTKDFEEECPILSYEPTSKASRKPSKKTIFTTPPPSPKKTLTSPKKLPRIPTATHSPSTDDFWKADVVNNWNDEFSPQKPLRPLTLEPGPEDLTGSPRKVGPPKKDKALIERKKRFNESKHAIALSFLRELDEEITDGKVSSLSASTGGVSIVWSKKLNTTAGRANWKREAIRSRPLGTAPPTTTYRHHASIELAEKVIDDEDRLLNVVAHEFCHLANFMVSGVTNNPHGKEFKAWASKCSARFGARGIEVTTKHSYEIAFKYVWQCSEAGCRLEFKRHSKSIDPKRHSCGLCKGRLVQIRPVPRGAGVEGKVMGEYQAYVRDNIGRVRKENMGSPQKDVMALVGRGYRELKAERLRGLGKSGLAIESVVGEKVDEVDEVESIVKKIDFLDLTTP